MAFLDFALMIGLPIAGYVFGGFAGLSTGLVAWILGTGQLKAIRGTLQLTPVVVPGAIVGLIVIVVGVTIGGWQWGWATGIAAFFVSIPANLATTWVAKKMQRDDDAPFP